MRQKVTLSASSYNISQRGDSLIASGLKVRSIDALPINLTKGIRELDLSHNLISKIENIKQFPYLQTLNISHNYISKGSQILKLLQSTKLIKVFVYGNPFLDVPLDEQVLQFLIEKETDIQILNGQNLNRIRDLQEGQLKVVFLQNYLKKMNCHQQIKSKHFSRSTSEKKTLLNEESTNKLIINKIMPQFFEIIDDPKLRNKLKKETIGIKRHEQVSFEDAMMKKKQRQQQQVNNLIKDIFTLVEDQDQSKNNHDQYFDQERRSPQIYDQQNEYQMQMEEQDEMKEMSVDPNYLKLIRKLQKSREKRKQIRSSQSSRNFDSKEINQPEQNKNTKIETSKMNKINLIPKNKLNTKISETDKIQTPENRKIPQSSNFYSFNKIPSSMAFNKSSQTFPQNKQNFSKTQRIEIQKQPSVANKRLPLKHQIKIQTRKQKTQEREMKKKSSLTPKAESQKSDIKNETKKFDIRIFSHQGFQTQKQNPKPYDSIKDILQKPQQQHGNHSIEFSNFLNTSNIVPSDLYQQYYAHLTKYNPTFALLYSDIQSLSPEQKSVLIDALAKDHKSKTIQLFIEREKTKNLKHYSHQNTLSHQKQKQQLLNKLYEWRQSFNITKEYGQQVQRENTRLNSLVKILSQDIKTTKKQNEAFLDQNINKDGEIRFLQIQVQNKNKQIAHLDKCQEIGDKIKENKKKWRKKQYLKIIIKRAHQYFQIQTWKKRRELKERNKIINICWSIMKRHLLTQVLVKMKANEKGQNLVKSSFHGWKNYRQQSKINEQKGQRLKKILKADKLKQLRKIIGQICSTKKERKLHKFWASHQFLKSTFYKLIKRTKSQKSSLSQKLKQSISHYNKYKTKQIFLKIKEQSEQTKSNVVKTIKMIEKQKKIGLYEKWKKLHRNNLIKQQVNSKYQSIGRILKIQLEYKKKCQMIMALKNQNEELKNKENMIVKERKKSYFRGFVRNYSNIARNKEIKNKNKELSMKVVSRNVYKKFVSHKIFVAKMRNLFVKAIKNNRRVQVALQRKQQKLQQCIKNNKTKQVFYNLIRNMYAKRVFQMQVQQRLQQEQTKLLMQKMRTLQEMQIQAIKSEYAKQMQQYHENQMRKDIDYRTAVLQYTSDNRQLEDAVMLMRGELEQLRNRENAFFKQKQLIEQQVRMAEQGKHQLNTMNQNLRMQLSSLSTKYERILELYSQSMFQIEQKGKLDTNQKQRQKQRQKERDKTVQKQKRIGVVKNAQSSTYRYKA